jgi:hypothetical protein
METWKIKIETTSDLCFYMVRYPDMKCCCHTKRDHDRDDDGNIRCCKNGCPIKVTEYKQDEN